MKILIVEDAVCMARAFEAVLTQQGHDVQCVVAFESLEPVVAITLDKEKVALDLSSFDIALVDGQLIQCQFQGPQVVQAFVARKLACVGISSQDEINLELITLGAKIALNKALALAAFYLGILTPDNARQPSGKIRAQLRRLERDFRKPEMQSTRRQLDALVMQFFTQD